MKIIEEVYGSIYKITFPNGKVYIGQTKRTLAQRGKEHLKDDSGCVKLKNAFKKYGHGDCTMEVMKDRIPVKYLDYWENHYIDEYDSIKTGYNIKRNTNIAIPDDLGIEYSPPEPKKNPFGQFAYSGYTPPHKKIDILLPKKKKRKDTLPRFELGVRVN